MENPEPNELGSPSAWSAVYVKWLQASHVQHSHLSLPTIHMQMTLFNENPFTYAAWFSSCLMSFLHSYISEWHGKINMNGEDVRTEDWSQPISRCLEKNLNVCKIPGEWVTAPRTYHQCKISINSQLTAMGWRLTARTITASQCHRLGQMFCKTHLTSSSTVLLEKIIAAQLVKKFPIFHETWTFQMEQNQATNLICYFLCECSLICWWYFNIAKC